VMVPVELFPPRTDVGFSEMDESEVGVIVSLAVRFVPPRPAVRVATVWLSTPEVETVKVAETLPAGILTVIGTVAAELSDDKFTTTPEGPARPFSVIVPVEDVPPRTVVGLSVRDDILATPMVKGALCVVLFNEAEMLAVVCESTPVVETVKVAELLPAATVTVEGTVAAELSLAKATETPDGPA